LVLFEEGEKLFGRFTPGEALDVLKAFVYEVVL
jgi:hypothetical protein